MLYVIYTYIYDVIYIFTWDHYIFFEKDALK